MKAIYICVFYLLTVYIAQAQWTNQNPVPDGNDLWSTFFIDDSTGWIIGSGGFIKKTTNAGSEWIQQNSGTTALLKSIQFVDHNTGWICGGSLIIKTTNGGLDWIAQNSGTLVQLTDIHFCTSEVGYVTGFGGTVLKTTNSGASWTTLTTGTTNDLYSTDFVSATTGWAVGGYNYDSRTIIKTTDGGINWTSQSVGINMPLYSVDFVDENTGFAVGGSYNVIKTTDGGNSWNQSLDLPFKEKEQKLDLYDKHFPFPYAGLYCVFFKDSNNGWTVGSPNSMDSYIYATTDAGITWVQKYRSNWQPPYVSVFVTQNGKSWAVGLHGLIGTKQENDSDWSLLLSGNTDKISSIYFINENIGWATASRFFGQSPYPCFVLNTTNGGKIWKSQLINFYSGATYRCVYFLNELFGWVAFTGSSNSKAEGGIFLTTDGGKNWTAKNTSGHYSSIFFINHDTGWVTSDYGSSSYGIYKSTDGGINLIKKSSISSSSIYFIDANTGWAVGAGGSILKSTDGGESWVNKTSGNTNNLNCIKFFNSNVGMCVGNAGTVLLSTDGGESWLSQNVGTTEILKAVGFTNSTTIWIAGYNGTIINSTDLGNNWTSYDGVTGNNLTSLSFINEYIGWVGGLNGTVLKYSVEPPTPPIWLNQITVEDGGGTESAKTLTIGQDPNATDSIDASLGEYELPPPPPTGIFDTRLNLPTNPQVSSFIDYRDSAETDIIWTITFQPSSAGYPITFSWDSTSFPEGTFYLKDRINGYFVFINMKNQSSYTLTNAAITSLSIIYKGVSSVVDINDEWNMISVPLLAEDMSLNNLFPAATSMAYGFEGGYVMVDTLVGGKGYWIKFDGNHQAQIYGSRMGDTVPLKTGWNMSSVYEEDIPISQITTTPAGIVATYFFGYNNGYYIADTLNSGQGYWVRVTEDGVINLSSGALLKDGDQEQLAKIDQNWGKIIITDNSDKSISLFAAEEKIESNIYELPPMPPKGIFDARYNSGRIAEDISSEQIIQISSDSYPITIKAEGLNITIRDRVNGKLLNEELTNGEKIRITNNKITSIEISGKIMGGLPVSYELYQNYPNPFNPSTTLKFAIPKESEVHLSIYNVLGELVTTLVKEQMKAGYYKYEFNALTLASGVYIYRIKAGDFIQTKKMVLLK
jgi:photosystem II stability/assembly factor-like uncharacterized protein